MMLANLRKQVNTLLAEAHL